MNRKDRREGKRPISKVYEGDDMEEHLALEARNIVKCFGPNRVLKEMNFQLRKGEIHALLGINGAGKSTLIKIISGAYKQDSGQVFVDGKDMGILTPTKAMENGISTIYQETSLFPELSIAENLVVGRRIHRNKTKNSGLLDWKATDQNAKDTLKRMGVDLPLHEKAGNIGRANMQLVEIARSLAANARILIMDEPTASLSQKETDTLFNIIRSLKGKGTSIIYISHRMEEIFQIADRITVLRDGQSVGTKDTKDATVEWVTQAMLGKETNKEHKFGGHSRQEVLLDVKNLGDGRKLKNINLTVHKGEIVCLGGLVGSGRTETIRAIVGIDNYSEGSVLFKGRKLKKGDFSSSIREGIGMIPEDRAKEGLILNMTAYDNFVMAALPQTSRKGIRNFKVETESVSKMTKELQLNPPNPNQMSRSFSGGNQQKVVIGKWLAVHPDLLVLDEPTAGVDVGAKFEIYKLIDQLASDGKGILVVSSDMEEVQTLADKIYIMRNGSIVVELDKGEEQSKILGYSLGGKEDV
jgi:ABC-type sugar transport system ATPase subunit